jgi:poly(ADP-ribose) glycohydrolase ARH3
MTDQDRFEGCLLGLALGDALGAPLEGGPLERFVWRLIGRTRRGEMRWTDDTQMSLDVAESLIAAGRVDPDDLAQRFAASYRWSRGYGPGAAKLLKRIARGADWREANRSVHSDGSYGNGGAMRAAVVGLFFASKPGELADASRRTAQVTHAHPLGVEGAIMVAGATAHAVNGDSPSAVFTAAACYCKQEPFSVRLAVAKQWLEDGQAPTPDQVRQRLGNGIAAPESCVTAVYVAIRFLAAPFAQMQEFVASVGGDVDTIGAMAGALWGAANGAACLPSEELSKLEQRERLVGVARALRERCR